MAGILDSVDLRTQMAGANRLEMLIFRLGGRQRFGINVFKVQEVIQCPPLTNVPKTNYLVRGVAHLRGRTIPILDLGMAIGHISVTDIKTSYIIITEYNRSVQGFLVGGVDRIINMNWKDILPPPKGMGDRGYLTAVTNIDNELVEIIDVEKVLDSIFHFATDVSHELAGKAVDSVSVSEGVVDRKPHILIADDSTVARNQVKRAMEQIGVDCSIAKNGREALDQLKDFAQKEGGVHAYIDLVISDIEMPEMDGYTLTTEIRKDEKLQKLHVLLHSSLSGVFNNAMVERVGANQFIAKFHPDELAAAVLAKLEQLRSKAK